MQVTAEQTDPCTLVLDIQVDEQQVARAFDSAYREFGRYANVPGFRPGKAPRAIVERYVDSDRVRQHTLEKIVRDTYPKAIEEQGITPYSEPDIVPTDLEDKKPYTYKATVPLEPQVTLGAYTGLTVEKPVYKVTDEVVADRIERLREENARLDRVTDRGVEAGDVLIAEVQSVLEGEEADAAPPRRQLVQMGSNIPGYDEAVVGMMPGDERTFELTYPEDFEEEPKRGKKATFTVKLSSISAKKLPELNDDFAKKLGAETVEEFRTLVRERLEAAAERLSMETAEQRLLEEILKTSEIHFPEVMARTEVQAKLRQLSQELTQHRMGYNQYLQQIGRTAEEHQAQLAAQADGEIRLLLTLREIALQEELGTDNDAIEAEFVRMLQDGTLTADQVAEYSQDQNRRIQVVNALVQRKLHDFLFAHNTIKEVEQEAAPDSEELAEVSEEIEAAE